MRSQETFAVTQSSDMGRALNESQEGRSCVSDTEHPVFWSNHTTGSEYK